MALTATFTATFTTHGTFTWVAPGGVSSVKAECWGGGGSGGGGDAAASGTGGGGGEYAAEAALVVTPGTAYTVTVGAAGAGVAHSTNGNPGGNSTVAGDAVTVTAHGGVAGVHDSTSNPAGGTGSTNTTHHDGGAGGSGDTVTASAGGGGSSAGPASAGGAGGNGVAGASASGGAGGTAPAGGGGGGAGGNAGGGAGANGTAGSAPGGAGGGGGQGSTGGSAGGGAAGQVVITWTMASPSTLAANTSGGVYKWTVPAGITTADAACWGSGAGGFQTGGSNGGAGGGGGEYAEEAALAVTAGTSYVIAVGAGGADGANGNSSTVAGDAVTVTAHGGSVASTDTTGGLGGTGSANTIHHGGGQGGHDGTTGGGGGGGSAGPAAAGNAGSNGATTSGGAGATAVTGGGPGGNGGNASASGSAPASGPGGGGGAKGLAGAANGAGSDGQLTLTYAAAAAAPFYPLNRPAHAPIPQIFRKGRSGGSAGAPLNNPVAGPRFYPLNKPAKAQPGVFRKGRAAGNAGAPVSNPGPPATGPVFYPLRRALRGRPGVFRTGRARWSPGAPVFIATQGPPFYPLLHPAGNAYRAPGPYRKGRVSANPGGPVVTTPYIGQAISGTSTNDYGWSSVQIATWGGNTLIVLAGWDLAATSTPAAMPAVNVVDSAGNQWIHIGTSPSSVTGSRSAAFVCPNAMPVTWVSVSATTFVSSLAYTVLEVVNMPSGFSLDVASANASTLASSLAVSPGSATTADIAFAVLATGSAGLAAPATPSGWTALPALAAGAGGPSPVQVFPFWNPALATGASAATSYPLAQAVPVSGVTFAVKASPPPPFQANPNMPILRVEAGFGATPGDPSQPPPCTPGGIGLAWTDITARVIGKQASPFISPSMGREYELATPEAGEMGVAVNNADGAFTPGNTASPYYPNVVLETPLRVSAYWQGRWYAAGFGYVERWPQAWPDIPQFGISAVLATDAMSVLNAATMTSALAGDMLLDGPYVLLPASEQYLSFSNGLSSSGSLGSSTAADAQGLPAANISRVNQRPGTYVDGLGATADTGQTTNLLGDSDTGFGTSSITTAPTVSSSGPGIIYTDPNLPDPVTGPGVTVEFWVIIPATVSSALLEPVVFSAFGPPSSYRTARPSLSVQINNGLSGNTLTVTLADASTVTATFSVSALPQQIALTVTSSSLVVSVDGAVAATASLSAAQVTGWNAVTLGCCNYAYASGSLVTGNFTAFKLGVYPYAVPTQRILSHYTTGAFGQQNTDATARIAQILSWGGLGIPRGGQTTFNGASDGVAQGPAYSLSGTSAADAVNQVALNHAAMVTIAPSGALVYLHKWALFDQSPVAVIGDSPVPGAGEIPYLQASSYDFDNTYLYDQTQVTQQVGPNTTITATATSEAAVASYFLRSALQQTIQTTSQQDAVDAANWNLALYSQPALRVKGVTIDASSNPAAFGVILALQQGQVATVTRRPVGGAEITGNYIIQKVEHQIGPTMWVTSVELAPYVLPASILTLDATGYDVVGSNSLG